MQAYTKTSSQNIILSMCSFESDVFQTNGEVIFRVWKKVLYWILLFEIRWSLIGPTTVLFFVCEQTDC